MGKTSLLSIARSTLVIINQHESLLGFASSIGVVIYQHESFLIRFNIMSFSLQFNSILVFYEVTVLLRGRDFIVIFALALYKFLFYCIVLLGIARSIGVIINQHESLLGYQQLLRSSYF